MREHLYAYASSLHEPLTKSRSRNKKKGAAHRVAPSEIWDHRLILDGRHRLSVALQEEGAAFRVTEEISARAVGVLEDGAVDVVGLVAPGDEGTQDLARGGVDMQAQMVGG